MIQSLHFLCCGPLYIFAPWPWNVAQVDLLSSTHYWNGYFSYYCHVQVAYTSGPIRAWASINVFGTSSSEITSCFALPHQLGAFWFNLVTKRTVLNIFLWEYNMLNTYDHKSWLWRSARSSLRNSHRTSYCLSLSNRSSIDTEFHQQCTKGSAVDGRAAIARRHVFLDLLLLHSWRHILYTCKYSVYSQLTTPFKVTQRSLRRSVCLPSVSRVVYCGQTVHDKHIVCLQVE